MDRFISKIPLFLAAVALAAGCAEKYPAPDHVVGVIAKDFTRTAYTAADDTLKGEWKAGDAISVNGQLFLADAAGRSSDFYPVEEFAGPQAPCTAWYPAEIARMELPQTQSWQAGGPFDVPMMATSPTLYLEFKPICGLLEICLSTALEGIEVQTLEISADKPLSGAFRVDEDRIVLTGEAENGIVMDCGAGVPLGAEPVSFWAVLPQDKMLENSLIAKSEPKRCKECGTPFIPNSNRAKYCSACAFTVHRRQKTESERKRRLRVDN